MPHPVAPAADCAREPIHLSGAIQPHGYLVSCQVSDWTIRQVSANAEALFGVPPAALLGETLREHVAADLLCAIADTVGYLDAGAPAQRVGTANLGENGALCDVSVHVADGLVHIEAEPLARQDGLAAPTAVAQAMISRLGSGDDQAAFLDAVAVQVRALSGYDRVMVYRFRDDDAGEVVAEAVADDLEPYLGLRYPASDIPVQARALYLRNRIRVIPDAAYAPVPIVPGVLASGKPMDLSQHALRSVSPVHLEYLRNMGVAASMSISIVAGGRLWGLVACHHRAPRLVPPAVRAALDLFGMFVSMRVSAREQEQTMAGYERAEQIREQLRRRLAGADDFNAALAGELAMLQDALHCDGAALWAGSRWHTVGRVPDPREAPELLAWLHRMDGQAEVVTTDAAADWHSGPMVDGSVAGVMGLCMGGGEDWLLLFRDEQLQDVRWAGEPAKALVPTDDGERIAPRRSFATWRQLVRGRSLPWSAADHRAAERLHRLLHESRRRALARNDEAADLEAHARRRLLGEQRRRLGDLSQLLEGLVHLDGDQTSALERRIRDLELELRGLMHRSLEPALDA
jgi:light-regulated signal transduction histidine kinase (bacteriophytochrome)